MSDDTDRFMPGPTRPVHAGKCCRHYEYDRGVGPRCVQGVDIMKDHGNTIPCLGPAAQLDRTFEPCAWREEFAEAERVAWEAWRLDRASRAIAIIALIPGSSRKRDEHWGTTGRFQCPACVEGVVSWVRTRVNGHVHARCSTVGCFEVME